MVQAKKQTKNNAIGECAKDLIATSNSYGCYGVLSILSQGPVLNFQFSQTICFLYRFDKQSLQDIPASF